MLPQQQNSLKRRMQEQAIIESSSKVSNHHEKGPQQKSEIDKKLNEDEPDKAERHDLEREIYVSECAIGGDFSLTAARRAGDLFYLLEQSKKREGSCFDTF